MLQPCMTPSPKTPLQTLLLQKPLHTTSRVTTDPVDEDFEASTMSDGLLDRKPRKRAVNLALSLEDLYKGGTKKLKVGGAGARGVWGVLRASVLIRKEGRGGREGRPQAGELWCRLGGGRARPGQGYKGTQACPVADCLGVYDAPRLMWCVDRQDKAMCVRLRR